MINTDPDARVWDIDGVEYTMVHRGAGSTVELDPNRKLSDWLDKHLESTYVITRSYIGFKLASDAIIFKLGFKND